MSDQAGFVSESLLDQVRAGDGQALGQLLESYRGYLRVLARVQIGGACRAKWMPPMWCRMPFWCLPRFRAVSRQQ